MDTLPKDHDPADSPYAGLGIARLDPFAEDCAEDGVYECWLTAAPFAMTGAVGGPVNPIAVK